MKIFLASPVYNLVHPEFVDAYVDTLSAMRDRGYEVYRHPLSRSSGSAQIGLQRSAIAEHFLRSDSEIMIQVDADEAWNYGDMIVLAEAIALGHTHIAGAAVALKEESCKPNIQPTLGTLRAHRVAGFHVRHHVFVEVELIGAGMIAVSRECVERVTKAVDDPPRTPTRSGRTPIIFDWQTVDHVYQSEDYMFEHRAKALGYKIHALASARVNHIGQRVYVAKLDEQLERMGVTIEFGGDE